ncbi:glycosyltransferase [Ruminococcus sp.]|jgi:glycosyltransferase involved in cell wall biosynthesis|uniref:glycosyltransferase n=1 Tax=Ruminococcus sp. TaxID=41978 RepID=UPI0025F995E9|nr:glycosyltransferase [Ruminococcus sp.]
MKFSPFSVAISVYQKDKAIFFDRALQSITEQQTVKPSEIVLVCDGPLNDDLNAVIDKYRKAYPIFKVLRLKNNKGLGNALRLAVENASYELIARMDSDDVSVPDRFEQLLKFFNVHSNVDIVGGDITEFIGDEDNIVGKRTVPKKDSAIKEYMKTRCAFNHVSVMYKKSAVQAAGGYLDWFWNEDYYLWIRMQLNNAVFANTGTVLVNVRVGEDMYQRRGGKKYFQSEYGLQKLMLDKEMIGFMTFICNVGKRVIIQRLLPNKIRGLVFRKFARN